MLRRLERKRSTMTVRIQLAMILYNTAYRLFGRKWVYQSQQVELESRP